MTAINYRAIDPWVLWDVAAGDPDVFRTLAGIYVEHAPALSQQLQRALEDGARTEIWQASHTLKGMAGMLGATELCNLLLQVELAARSGSPPPPAARQAVQLCAAVQGEVEHCAAWFDGAGRREVT